MPEEGGHATPAPGVAASLRPWQRFHTRLSLFLGFSLLATAVPLTVLFHRLVTSAALADLRSDLTARAVALAEGVEGEALMELARAEQPTAYRDELRGRFLRLMETDPTVESIYVLVPDPEPGWLYFAVDSASDYEAAGHRERYDARAFPEMLAGLERPISEPIPRGDRWGLSISGYAPVRRTDDQPVAVLGLDVDASELTALEQRLFSLILTGAALAVFVLAVATWLVGRSVRRPLQRLLAALGRMAAGELEVRAALSREDEFGLLGDQFDRMAAGLAERERIRSMFGRYVSEEVARAVLADREQAALGGEQREVTVLFSDLAGYSTISEQLEPHEVVDLLNRYLSVMSTIIERHDGVVIEFLGDAILAVFGAPGALPAHPAHATRCALEMMEALAELNRTWRAEGLSRRWEQVGLSELRHRIGVHCGPVVAGNLGSSTRTKYAVIGDTVNVAARLEQLNKELDSTLLISEAVAAELPSELAGRAEDRGIHQVKGRSGALRIYALSPAPAAASPRRSAY